MFILQASTLISTLTFEQINIGAHQPEVSF